jgi:hypothetical protein
MSKKTIVSPVAVAAPVAAPVAVTRDAAIGTLINEAGQAAASMLSKCKEAAAGAAAAGGAQGALAGVEAAAEHPEQGVAEALGLGVVGYGQGGVLHTGAGLQHPSKAFGLAQGVAAFQQSHQFGRLQGPAGLKVRVFAGHHFSQFAAFNRHSDALA